MNSRPAFEHFMEKVVGNWLRSRQQLVERDEETRVKVQGDGVKGQKTGAVRLIWKKTEMG